MALKKILIVDDALELGRLLKATLNTLNKGLDVAVVANAEEAYLEADKGGVDLLITDFRLSGVSATELIRKIRGKQPDVRVILITGLSDDQIPQSVKDLQVDFKLKKPMEIEEFLEAAKKCLGLTEGAKATPGDLRAMTANQVTELLGQLRGDLNALAICLVDENGNISAKVGEFPEKNFESRWIPSILSSVASDAKLLHLFTTPTGDGLHAYMGQSLHLIFMTVDENILIAVLKPEQGHSHLLMSIGVVIETQRELLKVLTGQSPIRGKRTSKPGVKPFIEKEQDMSQINSKAAEIQKHSADLAEFEAKLKQSKPSIAESDMDKFWETADEAEQAEGSGGIPYEEAKKMGLVEKEGKEK
jgi:two-component system response regulator (stage 0 sporulation protein F)